MSEKSELLFFENINVCLIYDYDLVHFSSISFELYTYKYEKKEWENMRHWRRQGTKRYFVQISRILTHMLFVTRERTYVDGKRLSLEG